MADFRKRNGGENWYFRFTNADGRRVERKGCPDRRATEEMARAAETQAAKVRSGTVDPRDLTFAAHEKRPLVAHLAEFRQYLEAKGSGAKHASVTANRAERVITLAKARRIADLSLSKTLDALATLRRPPVGGKGKGLSVETINHHVRAVKAFSRWLWKDKRAREHALAHLATSNPESDRRRRRRALTHEEAARLIQVTASGPDVMGMSGPDRAMAYLVALGTGFRSEEIRTLTVAAFDLASNPPTATVHGAYTKNGKEAIQPLPPALADRLRPWLPTRRTGCPVLPLPDRTAEMLRVDLEAAGIAYETPAGVVDFHALRGSYISHVVSSGASVKTAQTLARHSTPSLTIGIYAKASPDDITGAMSGLPDLTPAGRPTPAPQDTGVLPISEGFAPYLPLPLPRTGYMQGQAKSHQVAGDERKSDPRSLISSSHNPLQGEALDASSRSPTHADNEYRRWDLNPYGGSPPEDFKSSDVPSETLSPATGFRRISEPFAAEVMSNNCQSDPELVELIRRWANLPDALRAAITAIVQSVPDTAQVDAEPQRSTPRPRRLSIGPVDTAADAHDAEQARLTLMGGAGDRRGFVGPADEGSPARDALDAQTRSGRRDRASRRDRQ